MVLFICFVNSACEQRQGLAVLSTTTPWLSSKCTASHHDNHGGKSKTCRYPWTSSRLSQTCTNTLYRHQTRTKHGVASDATCSSKCWKKKIEEEEGGVTGLLLRTLVDDLRSGRGTEPDPPHPATEKWKQIRMDGSSQALQQLGYFLYEKKEKSRSVNEEEE